MAVAGHLQREVGPMQAMLHVEDAVRRFPDDRGVLVTAGMFYELIASPSVDLGPRAGPRLGGDSFLRGGYTHVDVVPGAPAADERYEQLARAKRTGLARAEEFHRRAAAVDAGLEKAHLRLGRVLFLSSRAGEALSELRLAAGSPDVRTRHLASLFQGAVHEGAERLDAAIASYEEAVHACPTCLTGGLALSHAQRQNHMRDVSMQTLEVAAGRAGFVDFWWDYQSAVPFLAVTLLAQQGTFKVSVDLVSVDVLVTKRGRPVTGLAASSFAIRDNNVLQTIDSISGEGTVAMRPVPLDVALVFDTGQSMAGGGLQLLVGAGKGVLERLRPGDRASLVTYSHHSTIRHALSGDVASVTRAVGFLNATGRTSMFDALYMGLSLRRTSDTRAMVLLFSDGRDNSSGLGRAQLLQVARESDVVVYAVGIDERIRDDMAPIAEGTGGGVIVAQSAKELNTLFTKIVREMKRRYVLNYYPNGVDGAGWHTLDVGARKHRGDRNSSRVLAASMPAFAGLPAAVVAASQ
jgi:VWFA-related protein